ncbi:Transcription initiation factor IID, subunit 13 [Dillenia turbinata]|uniref:Transcription initiation factor TFIID subunit 13 n=1 Tax=Dillenia turbinata TaxID=194707 RepID=A0AAN8ZKB7_9MAGN
MNPSSAGPSSKPRVGSSQPSDATFKRKRGVFQKDLQHMMYGFGDDQNAKSICSLRTHRVWYNADVDYGMLEIAGGKTSFGKNLMDLEGRRIELLRLLYLVTFDPYCDPHPETVALVDDIVVEYVTDMVHKAQDIASQRGKLLTEDFLYLIRKVSLSSQEDYPKLHRCTELLSMNEELKQARKAFEVDEEKLATLD